MPHPLRPLCAKTLADARALPRSITWGVTDNFDHSKPGAQACATGVHDRLAQTALHGFSHVLRSHTNHVCCVAARWTAIQNDPRCKFPELLASGLHSSQDASDIVADRAAGAGGAAGARAGSRRLQATYQRQSRPGSESVQREGAAGPALSGQSDALHQGRVCGQQPQRLERGKRSFSPDPIAPAVSLTAITQLA